MNELIERIQSHTQTPSDELLIFTLVFGVPAMLLSVVWLIYLIKTNKNI